MVQQADSILTEEALEAKSSQQALKQHTSQLTPKQVLSWLPKNATPAQQDSMIRAHIKPSEIHWSTMPDTLHLPGQTPGKSFRDVSLPQYYRESFFSKDSLFHPELKGGRLGVAGDPVPYTVAGDNFVTSLLLLCFLLACVAFAKSKHFVIRQARTFFRTPRMGTTEITETSTEVRFQFFFVLQTCLLLAIGYFIYSKASISDTFIIDQYQVISIYAGCIGGYFLLKAILYSISGWIFFDKKKNGQWLKAYLFLISCQGVLLFPMVMLLSYFDFSLQIAVIYTLVVLGLVKILSFFKSYLIFFRRNGVFLQIFLYFCALEVVPLFALYGGLVLISHYLKINF
ncbi:MAG TPA: DUF4271 domain-containing protein [Prevotella sp.]|nr:DUF4271 domain-containing protein [uncultured Prevotella sp.]HBF05181.1 DUF4271 domain-containing protein [Candidatus Segatella violae]